MNPTIPGIHHITALAGDPRRNVDFYTRVLGQRLVKRTVNFDDPGTYHLYYGDELGRPGTILTFFPWPGAPRGRRGVGQATVTAYRAPEGSLGYWKERLESRGLEVSTETRFEREVLRFEDPDGLELELVASEGGSSFVPWEDTDVPAEHALRGFAGVTLGESEFDPTSIFLTDVMGFRLEAEEGPRRRFEAGEGDGVAAIDVVKMPGVERGTIAAGSVHHIAWRTRDDEEQRAWQECLAAAGWSVTPVRDRQYFRSIYFHEPGGTLFEIATDPPGFTADESPKQLGSSLKLPPWLEPSRERIEAVLPVLEPAARAAK
ncbi:MAG TPA: ring-cleaving dioxygenase [Gemmatimonadota bacterium]|nr:ring-cleaving dioxygenase [Gemmatimonadota bacterium]